MDRSDQALNNSNMNQVASLTSAARGASPRLPTYALYGEPGKTEATDWLHCETIAERSAGHDWEIRPHRHETLFQILHIRRGGLQAWLEDGEHQLVGPCVLSVPALAPHGFRFSPGTEGSVITVLEPHWRALLGDTDGLSARLQQPLLLSWRHDGERDDGRDDEPGDDSAAPVARAVQWLNEEYAASRPWRERALDAALLRLAVVLARAAPEPAASGRAPPPQRALGHVRRYRDLVERQFRRQPALTELAWQIGITPTQLNRVCHQVLGHSALGVLHGRLVLEAQRDLAYTQLSVKQIALGLGFGDAGYFARFFQRQTGQTPTAWRASTSR
jgi:AraC family transcriptional regulator, transcriptional activator of pobA